ncbi:RING finger protein 17-like isoform X2 [Dreissena polymorpha]|uniref:RING finger protein 17-like isoform X2 n=1 Tax=Dreissena polymorpha TaxID=45954 RepID=UPI002264F833|nr:RING finger protein 17-like isoform X2 [Dreissena polymorpha]
MQKSPTCPKCNGQFIVQDGRLHKRPLLLNCGHTFCEACLQSMAKETRNHLSCPTCKTETPLSPGENSVKLLCQDRYMMGTVFQNNKSIFDIEMVKLKESTKMISQKKKNTENLCKECCQRQVTSHCKKCDCNLCMVCFSRVHSFSKYLQQHVAVPIEESSFLEISQMCKIHESRPIEYFCEDDELLICSRCVIQGNHKGHNISSIEDKNRHIIREMEPNLQVANLVFKKLKKIDKELETFVPDCQREVEPVLRDLRSHFLHLHGLLQVREQALEHRILQVSRGQLEPLEKLKAELDQEYKQLDLTIKSAHRIMNNNDEVIVNAKDILERLVHARDIPCIVELNEESVHTQRIVFKSAPLDTLLLQHGEISEAEQPRFRTFCYRDLPERFSMDDAESVFPSPPSTPQDGQSHQSETTSQTSQSDDVIIEEEQEVLLNAAGDQIAAMKVKSGPQTKLPDKPMFKGQNENVIVTHINSPNKFVVQLKRDNSKLATMSHAIQRWCNSPQAKTQIVTEVDVDDYVLVLYSVDKQWYRGRIKHVIRHDPDDFSKTIVEVAYFDFGNVELVQVDRLRKMQSKFMKHPEFSIDCCLVNLVPRSKDANWSLDAVQTFAKMVDNKTMVLKVVQEENKIMMVDLSKPADEEILDDRPISVRDALVFLELANLESPYSLPEPGSSKLPNRNFLTPSPKEEGESYPVIVSYAGTPDNFYVQELGEEADYLATMMAHIQDTYTKQNKDTWQIIYPQIGMICVAQFSGDRLWYRAKVIELPGNRDVTVQYVDYGNTERVNVFNIRKILDSFLILPAQAVVCSLKDVEPLDTSTGWTNKELQYWSEKLTMQKFVMKVMATRPRLSVVLREAHVEDMYRSINIRMVEAGMARSVGNWSKPQTMKEIKTAVKEVVPRLSYTVGSGSFPEPCDLEHKPVVWMSRNSKPTPRYKEAVETPPRSPERPAVKPQAGAKVKASEGDHGNQGKGSSKSPSSSGTVTPVQGSPQKGAKGSTEKPSSKGKATPSKEVTQPEVEVQISHFVNPTEFYLQKKDAGDQGLNQLMVDLHHAYHNTEVEQIALKKGSFCAAYSTSKGRWYRTKVIKLLHHTLLEVFMIDYGFKEVLSTSNVRAILRQFRRHASFCFPSKLYGLQPTGGMAEWSKSSIEFMQDLVTNRRLYLIKRQNAGEDNRLPIDLIYEEYVEETALEPGTRTFHSVIDKLKGQGLAIPIPKKKKEESIKEKEKVFPVLYYKKAEAEVKSGDKVMPVYVDYDAVVHCYTMEGDDVFQSMCDNLQQKFKYSDPHGPEQKWEAGQACAAFYESDQSWHRANIVQVDPDKVQVHFLDYGNSEWTGYEKLRADVEEFTHVPQQTFLCSLHDIRPISEDGKWADDIIAMMHKELVNNYCTISVVEKLGFTSKHMTVFLELNGEDYGSRLVKFGLAQRGEYITDIEMMSRKIQEAILNNNPFKKPLFGNVGDTVHVMVTHQELPNLLYLQKSRVNFDPATPKEERRRQKESNMYLDKLEACQRELAMIIATLPGIPSPKPGMACCAKYPVDKCWYRAFVVDVFPENKLFLVHFVDYGNTDYVPLNKMRALPQQLFPLPCQSHVAILDNVHPTNNIASWTLMSDWHMRQTVTGQNAVAMVKGLNPLRVELYVPGSEPSTLLYQDVIDQGFVIYSIEDQPELEQTKLGPIVNAMGDHSVDKELHSPSQADERLRSNETVRPHTPMKSSVAEKLQSSVSGLVTLAVDEASSDPESCTSVKSHEKKTEILSEHLTNLNSKSAFDTKGESEGNKIEVFRSATEIDHCSGSSDLVATDDSCSKSWADMVDRSSSFDIDELPEFDLEPVVEQQSGQGVDIVRGNLKGNAQEVQGISVDQNVENSAGSSLVDETSSKKIRLSASTQARGKRSKLSDEEKRRLQEERRKHRVMYANTEADVQHTDECFD